MDHPNLPPAIEYRADYARPYLFGLLSLTGFAGMAAPIVLAGPRFLTEQFSRDDTFYYLQIARHLAAGHGSTFDGTSATNGYQLLWQGILGGLAAWITDPDHLLRAALLLSCALVAAGGHVLARLLAEHCDKRDGPAARLSTIIALVPAAFNGVTGLLTGMEGALTFFFLAVLLRSLSDLAETRRPGAREITAAALPAGLLVLCRLDHAIVAGTLIAAFGGLDLLRRKPVWKWAAPVVGVAFGLLTAFTLYYSIGGTVVAVSGLVKLAHTRSDGRLATFLSAVFPYRVLPSRFFVFQCVAGLAGCGALIAWFAARRAGLRAPRLAQLTGIVGVVVVSYSAFLTATVGAIQPWYLAMSAVFVVLFASLLVIELRAILARRIQRRDWALVALASGTLIFMAVASIRGFLNTNTGLYGARYDMGRDLAGRMDPSCRLASFNAGQLGYYLDGNVVNLDGLVNSNEYRREVLGKSDKLEAFLRANGVVGLLDYDFYYATPILRDYVVVETRPIPGSDRPLLLLRSKSAPADCWKSFPPLAARSDQIGAAS